MTYELGKWSLDDLFPAFDSPEMEKAFKTLEAEVAEFEEFREKLSPDMDVEEFMTAMEAQEKSSRLANRVGQFAGLFFSEDTQNQDAQTFQAKMQQFMAGLQNRTLFFDLWWKSLEEEETKRFMEVGKVNMPTTWSRSATSSPTPSPSRKRRSSTPRMSLVSTPSGHCTARSPTVMSSR